MRKTSLLGRGCRMPRLQQSSFPRGKPQQQLRYLDMRSQLGSQCTSLRRQKSRSRLSRRLERRMELRRRIQVGKAGKLS